MGSLDRLGEVEGQTLQDHGLPLPDPEQYGENDIIVSDEEWYRLGRTDAEVANLFLGTVGHDTFRTAGSEEWAWHLDFAVAETGSRPTAGFR